MLFPNILEAWTLRGSNNLPPSYINPDSHLRDHLAEGRPKGLFHRTPWSCTLVLMSSTSLSECSMDDQFEGKECLDEDENIVSELAHPGREVGSENINGCSSQ